MPERRSRVTSSHWGAFRVITENGRIIAVEPFEAETQGNPNLLTRDRGTSRLGQGSSAHTTLVEIEPWNSE